MLDPWIIEQIRKREEEEHRCRERRPSVEMPQYPFRDHDRDRRNDSSDDHDKPSDRGVVIIDFSV